MFKKIALATAGLAVAASAVFAASHADPAIAGAVKARQSHMQLYAHNLGILGNMAQGKTEYDAVAAAAAADNLEALSLLSQAGYWPMESDAMSIEGTRALPALWEDMGAVSEKSGALVEAAQAMAAVAGTDLTALQGAMGALGGACGGCHKAFRQSQ